jgi:hypothetical protein
MMLVRVLVLVLVLVVRARWGTFWGLTTLLT